MRVLISGAGIAGLTVAYWLQRYGFAPTIVERAPSLLTGGYKIDVRGTALHVLRRMGIHDAVVAASTDMQGALLVDKDGKVASPRELQIAATLPNSEYCISMRSNFR